MPFDNGDRLLRFEAVLGYMQGIVDKCLGYKFIFGGDFNLPKHISSCENVCVKNFCANNNFLWADVHSNNVSYTYHNDKLQCFSLIDHILCSPELVRTQDCVEILLHGDNLSDHLAISCACSVSVLSSSSPKHTSLPSCTPKLNWDKGDITAYHTVLSQSLSNIALPTEALLCSGKECGGHHSCLQRYYSEIITSLDIAAKQCIPTVKAGVRKHWWIPDLDELKQQCIDICNLWRDIGCPRNGLVNAERLRCKYKYKQAIKDAAFNAEQSLNDELFNHLCTKDNLSFWKAWRKRFCANNVAQPQF